MSTSAVITYNGKTITLPGQGGTGTSGAPSEWIIDPHLERSINKTLTGVIETILRPRIDVRVSMTWPQRRGTDETLRVQFDNFWQYAQQGNSFRFVLDSAHTVKTTITGQEAAGDTTIVVASATGISANRQYVLVGGPNYQVVNVTNVAGTTITISPSLDFTFAAGSTFRDRYLWDAKLMDPDAVCPIRDVNLNSNDARFEFSLSFIETP